MTLSEQEIKDLLNDSGQVPENIKKARKYYKELRALIKGKDFDELLIKIEGIEHTDRNKARKLYSRSIKDLNARLLRHLDNIYSAAGGSKEYKTDNKDFILYLSNVSDNKSLEAWLKTYWIEDLYHTDPNGVLFLEWKDELIYPTYKSVQSIRNYKTNGQLLEWILFEPQKIKGSDLKKKYNLTINLPEYIELWRLVDDAFDYSFYKSGDQFVKIEELTFENLVNVCPGLINSDIIDIESGCRLSPIDSILELEKEFARDQSFKSIYKVIKANPLFWRYGMTCPACHGTGKDGDGVKCGVCDGSGKMRRRDVTDEVVLPLPDSVSAPIVPQPIAGFISPDLEVWTKYDSELKLLEDLMNNTHWGSIFEAGTGETATGRFIDTQPVINRLNKYSDVAEWMEKQLTEMIGNFKLNKSPNESICSISYGRRFIIESPDTIIEKYQSAKEKNSPVTVLDRYLSEYLTSKYKNDPETLRLMLIKKEIEPYVHYTLDDVKDKFGNDEAQKKMLFTDWWEGLNKQDITGKEKNVLMADFNIWYTEKTGTSKTQSTPLAVSLGVGGTQALQAIIVDPAIESEQKINILVILFGLTEEDAKKMVNTEPAEPGTNNNSNE